MSRPEAWQQIPLEYLLGASDSGLRDAMVKRLEVASAKRKEIRALLEEWATEQALALVFEWFLERGAETAARLSSESPVIEMQPSKPGPQTVEDFREVLKKLLESA